MRNFEIDIYVPLLARRWKFEKKAIFFLENSIDEISVLSDQLIYSHEEIKCPIEITFVEDLKAHINNKKVLKNLRIHDKSCEVLKFSIKSAFALEKIRYLFKEREISEENMFHVYTQILADKLYKNIVDLVICANIARPYSMDIKESYVFINNAFYIEELGAGPNFKFYCALEEAEKNIWPVINELSIKQVWDWANKIPGFDDAVCTTPLGRALGAMSYLLAPHDFNENELNFVWILVGLEALYCKGSSNIKSQLFDKVEIFLGPMSKNKKFFNKMYNFRSRLIHGDFDFISKHHIYDASDDFARFSTLNTNTESYALAILLATLQKMVINDLYDLKFTYNLM